MKFWLHKLWALSTEQNRTLAPTFEKFVEKTSKPIPTISGFFEKISLRGRTLDFAYSPVFLETSWRIDATPNPKARLNIGGGVGISEKRRKKERTFSKVSALGSGSVSEEAWEYIFALVVSAFPKCLKSLSLMQSSFERRNLAPPFKKRFSLLYLLFICFFFFVWERFLPCHIKVTPSPITPISDERRRRPKSKPKIDFWAPHHLTPFPLRVKVLKHFSPAALCGENEKKSDATGFGISIFFRTGN